MFRDHHLQVSSFSFRSFSVHFIILIFSAKVEPAYDASKVLLSGPGLESGKVGDICKFKADCRNAGDAPLTVDVVNEDGTKVPRVRVKDNGDGTHE